MLQSSHITVHIYFCFSLEEYKEQLKKRYTGIAFTTIYFDGSCILYMSLAVYTHVFA